jgi:hypothetical protein
VARWPGGYAGGTCEGYPRQIRPDLNQVASGRVVKRGYDGWPAKSIQPRSQLALLREGDQYALNAKRVQAHTPESLQALCRELRDLAEEYDTVWSGLGVFSIEPESL